MNIVIVGSGYVGLVTGACLAEKGQHVTCVDISESRIAGLKRGVVPIYEPGLDEIIDRNAKAGRLEFTTSLPEAMKKAQVYCIAVGTPPDEDGSADLSHVLDVAREIGQHMTERSVIINKSTVPVGTADRVRAAVEAELDKRGVQIEFDVVSNPEFLKEGVAIKDFMEPDRIVLGVESGHARQVMDELYAPFAQEGARIIHMRVRDAEMTKYAANAMLATRISFMNEIAGLCERLGVDVESVREGISADPRIGTRFIRPGAGYGGSCLPKDVRALARMAHSAGFDPVLLSAVEHRNDQQKSRLYEMVSSELGEDLRGKTVAVWGLAFKPGTDDVRESPALPVIADLVKAGAKVTAHDPIAVETGRKALADYGVPADAVSFAPSLDAALASAEAVLLVTSWPEYKAVPELQSKAGRSAVPLVDGRRYLARESLPAYSGIGLSLGR